MEIKNEKIISTLNTLQIDRFEKLSIKVKKVLDNICAEIGIELIEKDFKKLQKVIQRSLANKPTKDSEFQIWKEDACFEFPNEYFASSSQTESDAEKSKGGRPFKSLRYANINIKAH